MADASFFSDDNSWTGPVNVKQIGKTYLLKCPVCGFDYNHLGEPYPLLGWEDANLGEVANDWAGRGNGLVIPIAGECGHRWNLCLGFHKGRVAVFAAEE